MPSKDRPPAKVSYIDFGSDGMTAEQIAALENCSPNRIRAILATALKKCRIQAEKRGLTLADIFEPMGE